MSDPPSQRRDADGSGPEDELEHALLELERGQGSREQVLAALESAEVFVPRPRAAQGADRGQAEAEGLELPLITDADGRQAVPLFPSLARLAAAVDEQTAYFQVAFRALAEGWPPGVDAVIDPGGPLELTLAIGGEEGPAQPGPNTVAAGTRILVGDPAEEPEAALEALCALFASLPEVLDAYRAQVYIEAPGEVPHVAVGVGAEHGTNLDRLFQQASQAIGDAGPLSFLPLSAQADPADPIASYMLDQTSPFYTRP